MEQEYVNLLTLTEYHMIMSTITDKPYIDKDFNGYLFELKSDAEGFVKGLKNSSIKIPAAYYRVLNLCTELYQYGFKNVKIKKKGKEEFITIPITKADAKTEYYNHYANRYILRLRQTRKSEYLKELKKVPFLAPIIMDVRLPEQYPGIFYSYALFKSDTRYFVLFTTLTEFDEWRKSQMYDWRPAELSMQKFGRIRSKSPVLINPLSDRLILSDKQISKMLNG